VVFGAGPRPTRDTARYGRMSGQVGQPTPANALKGPRSTCGEGGLLPYPRPGRADAMAGLLEALDGEFWWGQRPARGCLGQPVPGEGHRPAKAMGQASGEGN
jgi:hypothetical protein